MGEGWRGANSEGVDVGTRAGAARHQCRDQHVAGATCVLAHQDVPAGPGQSVGDGATTALAIDSLTQAEQMFLDLVDPDGHPLAVSPAVLLVPNALLVKGSNLMNSTEVREDGNTGKSKYVTNNPHSGKFRVVRSSYLSNAQYAGSSNKAWYVLAEPNDMPVIEVAFLNGQQRPTVESADADFNVLGIQMRGYHDFGVALQEFRGGVKMKGEA